MKSLIRIILMTVGLVAMILGFVVGDIITIGVAAFFVLLVAIAK